jgi:hypothetical protein
MPALKLWSRPPPDDEPTHPDRDAPGLRVENVDELDAEEPTLVRQPRPYVRPLPEEVERLAFPRGITDETLIVGTRPNGYAQMRAWLVRLARDVGREYRERYGVVLRTNASAIEQMQRHLMGGGLPRDPRALGREIVRHGALLGEILARSLDASWTDVPPDLPATWEMFVPPASVVRPVARVNLFLQEGMRGEDLVAFYLELYTRARGARESGIEW